jgi:hypothetical protein
MNIMPFLPKTGNFNDTNVMQSLHYSCVHPRQVGNYFSDFRHFWWKRYATEGQRKAKISYVLNKLYHHGGCVNL